MPKTKHQLYHIVVQECIYKDEHRVWGGGVETNASVHVWLALAVLVLFYFLFFSAFHLFVYLLLGGSIVPCVRASTFRVVSVCVCVCIPYGKQREGVRVNENGAFLIACAEWGKRS